MFTNLRPVIITWACKKINSCKPEPVKVFRLTVSTSISLNRQFRSPIKFTKIRKVSPDEDEVEVKENTEKDPELDKLLEKTFLIPGSGHQVFVIQPYIKWGPEKKKNTTPELQLMESVTLIKTLRQWKVVDQTLISLETFNKKTLFGKGNLEHLRDKIRKSHTISAVFISVNTLTLPQQITLQEIFGVPVFDRYTIIMHIFKEHAKTREAKLQIQLAQLPYLWMVLRGINLGFHEKLGITGDYLGGEGLKSLDTRKEVFRVREAKLKREILELREQRESNRQRRSKSEIPVVAVVGYTNAGKTALVKALTGKNLEPQDYLFATLDVTSHLGKLPSGLEVYFVDTLGFINDIPTYLIESFVSTLEDAISAHVIIHVRDISHPDTVSQNDNVIQSLKNISTSENLMENIITVGNKIDLLKPEDLNNYKDLILVSSTKMTGIDVLRQEVEKKVLLTADKQTITIKVLSGGKEYYWLQENSNIVSETPDSSNYQYILVKTIISSSALAKFKYHFIEKHSKAI